MSGPVATRLPGNRLHLQHGPIDLVVGADGAKDVAFDAAFARLETVLAELTPELDLLRQPTLRGVTPRGSIARQMHDATLPFSNVFITPMASVAGAVAQSVLRAMVTAAPLTRAYVNNGGDIALHLEQATEFSAAMAAHDGTPLGTIRITSDHPVRGIATSARHGRSLSLGIADSVTVLARTAAMADAAATLIANAVDLPGNPAITRKPANSLRDDSDLGSRLVVTHVAALSKSETDAALTNGVTRARAFLNSALIYGASLHLNGETRSLNMPLGVLDYA